MTLAKLCDRLLAFGPPVLRSMTRRPNHCVFAAGVAIDVLRAFGEDARPLSVRVVLTNAHLTRRLLADRDLTAAIATGGHLLTTGDTGGVSGPDGDRVWSGHLIAWLPARGQVIDLNHGAFSRPKESIVLPPATVLPFTLPGQAYAQADGCRLELIGRPDDQEWQHAADWIGGGRRRAAQTITRAVRAGRL